MPGNAGCTVFVGNLDERVGERVLYDILIQAGRVVDLHIPRDRETDRPKGIAFAEYETEEIADYAVKLFSGLVTLHSRTLRFAISGQDKPSTNLQVTGTGYNSSVKPATLFNSDLSPHSVRSSMTFQPGVVHQSNGYRSHTEGNHNDYSRRAFGSAVDSLSRSRSNHGDRSRTTYHPSH